jgi:putative transposase
MDETHLLMAVRYVELNPVRAGISLEAQDYQWSSAVAHLNKVDDELVKVAPMLNRVNDWQAYLSDPRSQKELEVIRNHKSLSAPLALDAEIKKWESEFQLDLAPRKRGRKPGNIEFD